LWGALLTKKERQAKDQVKAHKSDKSKLQRCQEWLASVVDENGKDWTTYPDTRTGEVVRVLGTELPTKPK